MNTILDQLTNCGAQILQRGQYQLVCMPDPFHRLSVSVRSTLITMFTCFADRLIQKDTSEHWNREQEFFFGVHRLLMVFKGDALYGFSATRIFHEANEHIIYVDRMVILPTARPIYGKLTIGAMLICEMIKNLFPITRPPISFVFRTQNPNVYRLGAGFLGVATAPAIDGRKLRDPKRCARVLEAMAKRLSPNKVYDAEKSIIRGAYSHCVYGRPFGRAKSLISCGVTRFWNENMDVMQGDALLIVVSPTHAEIRRFVVRYALLRIWLACTRAIYLIKKAILHCCYECIFRSKETRE